MIATTEIAEALSTRAHGTRSRYVGGCRCEACRAANRDRYRARQRQIEEGRASVTPTGPAIESTMVRAGRTLRIRRCPGANGDPCVKGALWLRGQGDVCAACVERVTVWSGLVSPAKARAHLLALRRKGVGYRTVASACDVAPSTLGRILRSDEPIRKNIERAVLAVDADAKADAALVDARATNRILASILARGFTRREVATLLGYASSNSGLQVGGRSKCQLATVARVARLWRRVLAVEVFPKAWGNVDDVRELLRRGVAPPIAKASAAVWAIEMAEMRATRNEAA